MMVLLRNYGKASSRKCIMACLKPEIEHLVRITYMHTCIHTNRVQYVPHRTYTHSKGVQTTVYWHGS